MAISRPRPLASPSAAATAAWLILAAAPALSREVASPSTCQALATQSPIAGSKAAAAANPDNLQATFALADAWSDAGCFNDAVHALESAAATHPASKELDTRLRVAKSLVGEERFFDNLDKADKEAQLKRSAFRCSTLADLDACGQALQQKPDDPTLLVAQGDALLHAKRPADALGRYRLAAVIAPQQHDVEQKISTAESQLPTGATAGTSANADAGATAAPAKATVNAAQSPSPSRPLRVAASPTNTGNDERPTRHYSNAAPDSHTH